MKKSKEKKKCFHQLRVLFKNVDDNNEIEGKNEHSSYDGVSRFFSTSYIIKVFHWELTACGII